MRDSHIREALVGEIRRDHPERHDNRIWSEFALAVGSSRVDVCLINGSLTGWEIKSPRDNLERLPAQVHHYGRVLDYALVVTSDKHIRRIADSIPDWWGIIEASPHQDSIAFSVEREPLRNTQVDPFSLAQLLWREEALEELRSRDLHRGLARATRWGIWDRLAENLTLEDLSTVVRDRLKARPARQADSLLEPSAAKLPLLAK